MKVESGMVGEGILTWRMILRDVFDIATSLDLLKRMETVLSAGAKKVIVDLTEVTQFDDVGLGALRQGRSRFKDNGGEIILICPKSAVRYSLTDSDVGALFRIVDTLDQALELVRKTAQPA